MKKSTTLIHPVMTTKSRLPVAVLVMLLYLLLPGISIAQDYYFAGFSSSSSTYCTLYINGSAATFVDAGWHQQNGSHNSGNNNYLAAYTANNESGTFRDWFVFDWGGGTITSATLRVYSYTVYGTVTYTVSALSGYDYATLDANRSSGDATGKAIFAAIYSGTYLGQLSSPSSSTYYDINLTNLSALQSMGSRIYIGGRVENVSSYTAPSLTTNAATSVTSTGSTLNASINPNGNSGTCYFQYGTSSGSYTTNTTSQSYSSSTSSYNQALTGLTGGTTYYYRAYATVSGHSDVAGSEQSFTTPPPNLTSISPSASTICNGGSTTLTANGTISGGTVYWYTGSCGGTSAGTGNTLTVYPTSSTTYYARNYKGGQYSAGCVSTTITVNNPATTPASATCTGTTATTASLSWGSSTGTGTITYYWVVGTSSSVTYPSGTTGWSGSTTDPTKIATATNLSPSTTYYLRVMAGTASPCSNSAYQTSSPFTTVPAAPVATTATLIRANSFTANWNTSTGATKYYLDVSTDINFGSFLSGYQNKDMGTNLSAALSGLSRSTNYYYRVRATNAGGTSLSSNTITVETLPLNNFLVEKVGGGNIGEQTSGNPFSIQITARDAMNSTVTDYTGTATITTNSTLTAGSTTGNFTAGVLSSHSVTLTLAGTLRTLTATSGSASGTSNTFTVLPGAINYWSLVVNGTVTAGVEFTVTATVYDVFGNIKTNYTGLNSVQWTTTAATSANGTPRVIPANGNQTFANGVATVGGFIFYNSDQSPLPTITVTDGPTAVAGTTTPITVYNKPLDNFKVVAGTEQQAGIPFDITVTARDMYWNTCRDYVGNVRFKSSDDDHVVFPSGLQPFVLSDHGVRTFTNGILINTMGAYWVRAADAIYAYKSGEQQNIVVGPGPFDQRAAYSDLFISNPSTPATYEDPLYRVAGEYVLVTAIPRDQFGNLLYACRDISIMLNGSTSDINGPIVVSNVGDGSYTAMVRVSMAGTNIISGRYNATTEMFLQTRTVIVAPAPPDYLAVTGNATQIAGASQNITITAYDVFNNVAVDYDGNYVHTFSGANPSPVPSSWPTIAGVIMDGVNTVTLSFTDGVCSNVPMVLYKMETAHITTSDGELDADAHKLNVEVSHAPTNYFTVTGNGTQTAGTSQTITVSAFDAFNNPATGYAGSHDLTFDGAGATAALPPSPAYTPTVAAIEFGTATPMTFNASGQATGSMVLYLVETAHITAADGLINADDHKLDVDVSHAGPDFLTISGSPTQIAGTSQTITIRAYDHYNNLATGYEGSKSLTFSGANASPTPGTDPTVDDIVFSNPTSITFSDGEATGSMKLYAAETAHITATDGAIDADDHKLDVVVSDAVHAYLKITGTGTQTAGTSQNITITAYDEFNNVAIAYTGNKTLTFSGANPSPDPASWPTIGGVVVDGTNSVSLTFVNGVCSGVPMVLYKAETAEITAFDNTVPPINADLHKLSVIVDHATPDYLTVTGTGTQVAGTSQTITVTAYDAYNNLATGYTGGHSLTFSGANPSPDPATNPKVAGIAFGSPTNLIFTDGSAAAEMYLYKVETAEVTATDGTIDAEDHELTVVVSHASPDYLAVTGTGTQEAGTSQTITVTAYDAYNNVATGYEGSKNLTFSGANPSPLPATNPTVDGIDLGLTTSLTFTAGVATGTMYLYKVETAHISANDGEINATEHKLTVLVSHAAPAYLAVTGNGTQTAGDSQTITVTAYDAYNNVATGYEGSKDLTFSGANPSPDPATNPIMDGVDFGSTTSLTFTSGVATGTMYLYKVETAEITATDGSINANTHKLTVVVSHDIPAYLTVTGTGTQTAGTSQTITVTAYDAFNNLATGYTGGHSLTFSGANPSPAPATNPTVAAIAFSSPTNLIFTNGVAAGTMYLYKVETAHITATDGSINADAHKLDVVVSHATPNYLAVTGTGTQTAGDSQTITVTAYDAYNNVATGYEGSKDLTFSGANPSPAPETHPTVASVNFGSTTSLIFTSGVATGTMYLYKVETAHISADDGTINASLHKLDVVVSHATPDYLTVTGTGTQVAGTSQTITVTAYDAYNNLATGYNGPHSLTFAGANPSPAPATNPKVAAIAFGSPTNLIFTNGVAAGTMYLYKVETAHITATDGSINADAHKLDVVVSHAAPSYLAVTGTGTQEAGTSQTITVTAYDVYNNVATGYEGSKDLIFSGANPSPDPATNPIVDGMNFGSTTSLTFTSGVATGTMYLYKVETAYINADDGEINATEHKLTVVVSHTAPSYLAVTGNGTQTAGDSQTITVTAYDAYNNVATGYEGSKDLIFSGANPSPNPATNPTVAGVDFGSTTSLTFTSGVATGTMYLFKVETAHINANDGSINASSHKLNVVVSHDTPAYLTVTGTGTQIAGTSQLITVTAYDAYNNLATGYTGGHSLTFSGANPSPAPATNPTVAAIAFSSPTNLIFTNGVAAGTMYLYKVETAHITATDGSINADAHKLDVVVSHAAPAYLAVTGTGTQTAGDSQTITVTAYDAFNNVATGYEGSKDLVFSGANPSPDPASNPTVAGVNFGSTTSLIFTSGVATGTMYLYKVETAHISADDGTINASLHKLDVVVSHATPDYLTVTGTGTQVAGTSQTITVTAYDAYNNLATGYTGSHNLTFTGAHPSPTPATNPKVAGIFFGNPTNLVFTDGVASANMYLYKVETAEINATDFTIDAEDHELTVVVSHAAPNYLAVTGTGTQEAGTSQTITVTAYDVYNNVATGYEGSKNLTFSGANPSPDPVTNPTVASVNFGSPTSLTFTSGVATGTMYLYKVETALITTGDGLINANSHKLTVVVNHAPASKLAILTQPSATATAGVAFVQQPVIRIEDPWGNLCTTDTRTITATRSTGTSVLHGTTSLSAVGGVATFTDLSYNKAETITVLFSSTPALATATSTNIVVGPNVANYFAVTGTATQMAGSSQTITVTAYDAYDNVATGYVGTKNIFFSGANPSPSGANPTVAGNVFGNSTPLVFVSGVASASMTLYKTEIAAINVTEGVKTADLHKLSVTVTPTLLKDFIVYGVPDPHDLGTWQSVTVEARDTYQNRKTNYTRRITFSNTDVSAINPGDYTFTVADQGIHTFTNQLKFSAAGDWWLTAIDLLEPTKYGAQADITVQRAVRITANNRSKTYGNLETLGAMSISSCTVTGIVSGVDPVPGDITGITLTSAGSPVTATVAGSPYAIVPSAATGPYNPAYYRIEYSSDGLLTVNTRPLAFSNFLADDKMYDGTTDVTGTGFSDDRVNSDVLTFSYNASFEDKHVGLNKDVNFTDIAISGGAGATNYYLVSTTGTAYADISMRPINVTAQSDTKIYDGTDESTVLPVVDALQTGDVVTDPGTQTYDTPAVGTGKTMSATGTVINDGNGGANYDITYVDDHTGEITHREITVTADAGQTKVYGEDNPALYTYTLSYGTLADGESFSGALTRDPGESVGSYAIKKGTLTILDALSNNVEDNYTVTFESDDFTITTRPITIAVDNGQTKVYGDTDMLPYTYSLTSGTLATGDEFAGELSREPGEDVGSYLISKNTLTIIQILGGGNKETNYDVTFEPADFTITQRVLTVTANAGQTKTYGHTDPLPFTYSITDGDLVAWDTFDGALTRESGETIGDYTILIGSLTVVDAATHTQNHLGNYFFTYNSDEFSITKRPITITADAGQRKTYGDSDPLPFTYTITGEGLAGGDEFSGVLDRVSGENVSGYEILKNTFTIIQTVGGGNKEDNYDVTYYSNDFTIDKRAIEISVNSDQNKVYAEPDPVFTFTSSVDPLYFSGTFTGALERETGENVANDYTISRGTLQISDGNSSTSLDDNYDLTFVPADFEITKKAITITVDAGQTKVYGYDDPTFTYVSSVDPLPFSGTFTGVLSRDPGNNVGSAYAIGRGSLQITDLNSSTSLDDNYDLTFVGDDFTITQRPITITANDRTKIYGNTIAMGTSQFWVGGDGMAYSETITSVDLASTGEPISAHIGDYPITTANAIGANGYLESNYDITYSNAGTLTITIRTLHLSNFGADSKIYDGTTVATGIGFDDDRIPGDNLAFTRDAAFTDPNVGDDKTVHYTNIVISGGTDKENYVLASTEGNAIADIYARGLTITADDVTKPYGITLTGGAGSTAFTASGLQNGETVGTVTLAYGTGSAPTAPLGTYYNQVTPSAATGGTFTASNYSITYASGKIIVINSTTVSGHITYNNSVNTPMSDVTVTLQGTGMTTTTDATGYYEFINVPAGTYTVEITTSEIPGEAVNASDAAQANAWYISENQYGQWPSIQKTRFFAGDVTNDHYVASSDAQQMKAFFVNSWGTWAGHTSRADWTFWKKNAYTTANPNSDLYPTITVEPLVNLNQDFFALVTGDFNCEYIPGGAKAATGNINLGYGETIRAHANDVVDLPVIVKAPYGITAVSMILNFPADKLEVLGVTMNGLTSAPLSYNVMGDEIRIGWNDLYPLSLDASSVLLSVKVKVLAELADGETARFALVPSQLNELADGSYGTISNATLEMDIVGAASTGTGNEITGNLRFSNYPNPFTGSTTLAYSLPSDGDVTIEIRNMLGSLVKTVVDNNAQEAGDHKIKFDASALSPGVYSARLNYTVHGIMTTRTIKIIRNN